MKRTYTSIIDGRRVTVFDHMECEEFRQMVDWCRINIGRSRGDSSGTWWVIKIRDPNDRFSARVAIAMKPGKHLFLAQLIWA